MGPAPSGIGRRDGIRHGRRRPTSTAGTGIPCSGGKVSSLYTGQRLHMGMGWHFTGNECVGLCSTRFLCHIEVGVAPLLPYQELALSYLAPGAVAQQGRGVSVHHGKEHRAYREGWATTARVRMKGGGASPH